MGSTGSAAATISKLPRTRAWLAAALDQGLAIEDLLQPLSRLGDTSFYPGTQSAPSAPLNLRTGRNTASHPISNPNGSVPRGAKLATRAALRSWQGLARLGLVALAAMPEEIGLGSTPETLHQELGRLSAAQNDFQRILVQAACSLLLQRVAAGHGRTLSQSVPSYWSYHRLLLALIGRIFMVQKQLSSCCSCPASLDRHHLHYAMAP